MLQKWEKEMVGISKVDQIRLKKIHVSPSQQLIFIHFGRYHWSS